MPIAKIDRFTYDFLKTLDSNVNLARARVEKASEVFQARQEALNHAIATEAARAGVKIEDVQNAKWNIGEDYTIEFVIKEPAA